MQLRELLHSIFEGDVIPLNRGNKIVANSHTRDQNNNPSSVVQLQHPIASIAGGNVNQKRYVQLIEAYELVAKCDNDMVGVVEPTTVEELVTVENMLINRLRFFREIGALEQNTKVVELALDLVRRDRKGRA